MVHINKFNESNDEFLKSDQHEEIDIKAVKKGVEDIKAWVIDEQNPKKYKYLIENIDYVLGLLSK